MAYLVLEYVLVGDYLDRRGEFRDEHLALAGAARSRGELLLAGALDPADRALFVWVTDDAAVVERFAEQDPYVRHGLVSSYSVRPWRVVIDATPAATS
ncbi:MAG: YciI-like protein [Actinomycetota bacterium]